MTQRTLELLRSDATRLASKGLFGGPEDSLSLRIPGQRELLLQVAGRADPVSVRFDAGPSGPAALHASIYEARHDAGAILVAKSPWTSVVAEMGVEVPSLFDEQARHIGKTHRPVAAGNLALLAGALREGGNVAICGPQRICLGPTASRVVLNAELFEKCAKAFVLARLSGDPISVLPPWMRWFWGRRLQRDQIRAAESYASGRSPEGMDAY